MISMIDLVAIISIPRKTLQKKFDKDEKSPFSQATNLKQDKEDGNEDDTTSETKKHNFGNDIVTIFKLLFSNLFFRSIRSNLDV